jgi:hypothetical protein
LDTLETNNLKEFNDIQMDWILGYVRSIRNYLASIEFEAHKGKRSDFISTGYIFEKTQKAMSDLEQIEVRAKLFNHPE